MYTVIYCTDMVENESEKMFDTKGRAIAFFDSISDKVLFAYIEDSNGYELTDDQLRG